MSVDVVLQELIRRKETPRRAVLGVTYDLRLVVYDEPSTSDFQNMRESGHFDGFVDVEVVDCNVVRAAAVLHCDLNSKSTWLGSGTWK